MRAFPYLAILCAPALRAAPAPAEAQGLLAPDEITINSVATSGSGCPRKTVTASFSQDRTVVTLGFDEFQTHTGPGSKQDDRDKECDIRLNVHVPGGATFSVLDATYHGFAQLDSGVKGTFSSQYSFAEGGRGGKSGSGTCGTAASLDGGGQYQNGSVFTKQDQVPTLEVVNSPCGRNATLLIRTRINLNSTNTNASGTLTDDDATFAFTQQLHFGWQTCKSERRHH